MSLGETHCEAFLGETHFEGSLGIIVKGCGVIIRSDTLEEIEFYTK